MIPVRRKLFREIPAKRSGFPRLCKAQSLENNALREVKRYGRTPCIDSSVYGIHLPALKIQSPFIEWLM